MDMDDIFEGVSRPTGTRISKVAKIAELTSLEDDLQGFLNNRNATATDFDTLMERSETAFGLNNEQLMAKAKTDPDTIKRLKSSHHGVLKGCHEEVMEDISRLVGQKLQSLTFGTQAQAGINLALDHMA